MDDEGSGNSAEADGARLTCQSIDWYAEGQSRTVDVAGIRITVRFVGRRGRRGRIAIETPGVAVFQDGNDSSAETS